MDFRPSLSSTEYYLINVNGVNLVLYAVCFYIRRDAGEDEGDLDFSALLKAAKK